MELGDQKGILSAVRNPLSIIGLFVLLVEVVVYFALKIEILTDIQRTWLVVFCTLFPVLVLLLFFLVVLFKPQNLFGPLDYSDPRLYLLSLRRNKINKELDELQRELDNHQKESKDEDKGVKPQNNRSELMLKILNSEDLVMRELEKEFGLVVERNVISRDYRFIYDGIIKLDSKVIRVEVKYFSGISSISRVLHRIRDFMATDVDVDSLLLAIVTDSPLPEETINGIKIQVMERYPQVLLRFYSF